MKILLLGFSKLKFMPYAYFYLNTLNKVMNDIHVVVWNRDVTDEQYPDDITIHEFRRFQNDEDTMIKKVVSFISYKRYAEMVIKKERPDRIIVLHTMPGILMYWKLIHKYNNKFIFDYRDATHENNALYKRIVTSLIEHSYITFFSSKGFVDLFPDKCREKISITHNLSIEDINNKSVINHLAISLPIKISYWGLIREEKINREIIKRLSNDLRFELHYYGREQDTALRLKEFADRINATNVFFHGEYNQRQRKDFASNTGLIHNIFDSVIMNRATSNRFYDGLIFGIPQLCMEKTYMGDIIKKYEIGFECNPYDEKFCNSVYEYYMKLNYDKFYKKAKRLLDTFEMEYKQGQDIIRTFASEGL